MLIIENGVVYQFDPDSIDETTLNKVCGGEMDALSDFLYRKDDEIRPNCLNPAELQIRLEKVCDHGEGLKLRLAVVRAVWKYVKDICDDQAEVDEIYRADMKPEEVGNHVHGEEGGGFDLDKSVGIPCSNCSKLEDEFLRECDQAKRMMDMGSAEEPPLEEILASLGIGGIEVDGATRSAMESLIETLTGLDNEEDGPSAGLIIIRPDGSKEVIPVDIPDGVDKQSYMTKIFQMYSSDVGDLPRA